LNDVSVHFDVEQARNELTRMVSGETVIRTHEPLAKRTTLRVGGPADLFIEPGSETDLATVLRFARDQQLPVFVLGRGSNLLVKDGGFRGAVVWLGRPAFAQVKISGAQLQCGAGARLKAVAMEAKRNGIAGLEFLEGIPGSVGGALRMNAGAMGGTMFDVVVSVRLMDFSGRLEERARVDLSVEYRSCSALKNEIALAALLCGQSDSKEAIERRMNEFSRRRWASQPAASSAGCMFKNPATVPAGKLIDELGLKGMRVGGAMVSLEHGNFLVNDGTATARDVLDLIEVIRSHARTQRGIDLETEVEIIGE
jgi:UDP-N-acetylenolpyruvoylglucosamine reductase